MPVFAKLLELYAAHKPQPTGVSSLASIDASSPVGDDTYVGEFAVIGKNVRIGRNVKIYPQVYVGDHVTLGDNVTIFPGAKIFEQCVLKDGVVINAGAVIGADGFGFAPDDQGVYHKIPQLGNVVLKRMWISVPIPASIGPRWARR